MKLILENIFGLNRNQINIPFVVEDVPMGVVTDVTEEKVSVLLWDKYVTVDKTVDFKNSNNEITAIHIKHKMSDNDMINSFSFHDKQNEI